MVYYFIDKVIFLEYVLYLFLICGHTRTKLCQKCFVSDGCFHQNLTIKYSVCAAGWNLFFLVWSFLGRTGICSLPCNCSVLIHLSSSNTA